MLQAIYFALHFAMIFLGVVLAIHFDFWIGVAIATTFTVNNPILKYTQITFKNLFIAVLDINQIREYVKVSNFNITSSAIVEQDNFAGVGNSVSSILDGCYWNFDYIKELFHEANDTLNVSISKLIFD